MQHDAAASLAPSLASTIDLLSRTPTSQLAILLTQHPSLGPHLSSTLRLSARSALTDSTAYFGNNNNDDDDDDGGGVELRKTTEKLIDVLHRLAGRGDPSLLKSRVFASAETCVDLALAASASSSSASTSAKVASLLAFLLTRDTTDELLDAAFSALEGSIERKGENGERSTRAARIVATLVGLLPVYSARPLLRKGREEASDERGEEEERRGATLQHAYENATAKMEAGAHEAERARLMHTKVSLLDAAWGLLHRRGTSAMARAATFCALASPSSSRQTPASASKRAGTPLVDLPLLLDLALVRPAMIEEMQSLATSAGEPASRDEVEVRTLLKRLQIDLSTIAMQSHQQGSSVPPLKDVGGGWSVLQDELRRAKSTAKKGKEAGEEEQDDGERIRALVEGVLVVLPHLQRDVDGLERRLRSAPKFAQATTVDHVVALLLDEQQEGQRLLSERAASFEDGQSLPPLVSSTALSYGKRKGKGRNFQVGGMGLEEDLKRSILERAERPDSDEEEEREVWDPFKAAQVEIDAAGKGQRRQRAGGDADADDDDDALFDDDDVGAGPSAARGRLRREEGDDDSEEDEDEHDNRDGGEARRESKPRGVPATSASVADDGQEKAKQSVQAERKAERILIAAYKEAGAGLFHKDARKTKARKNLVDELNQAASGSKKWDDGFVESWATMFERNVSLPCL